jgi:molybdopterin-guanine dinucleotide biosynthesis protein A
MGPAPDDTSAARLGAVVLTGGSGSRMGGVDKGSIELDGVTLLERALSATVTAVEVVVVGDQVPTSRPVTWTREDPSGGGPAAGLLAGLDRFLRPPDLVAVLAVDMPLVGPGTFARLLDSLDTAYDGALLVDDQGKPQPLCGVYRRAALEGARPEDREQEHGLPVHRLLGALTLTQVEAVAHEADDVDTWTDLKELRESRER